MSVPIRLRGPQGISTIQVSLEAPVSDLQQAVFAATEIPPTLQDLRTGYPPAPLTLVPSLPISSLGLKRGDVLVVSSASRDISDPNSSRVLSTNKSKPESAAAAISQHKPSSSSRATDVNVAPMVAPALASRPPAVTAEADDAIPVDGAFLVLRVVPDDNSCLFSTIAVIFEQNIKAAPKLRQVVADAIRKDPIQFDDVFLGRPRDEYIATILKPASWGGAIELSIFAEHYQTEISSFDVETGRCDRFGEGKWDNRCIVMYSGIHYDATSLAPTRDAPADFHQTVFPVSSASVLSAAEKLAAVRRAKRAYTNTATFDLRCQVCSKGLKGEKGAREHAQQTGHVEFGEY